MCSNPVHNKITFCKYFYAYPEDMADDAKKLVLYINLIYILAFNFRFLLYQE